MPEIAQYGFEFDGLVLMMIIAVQVLFLLVFAVLPMSAMDPKNRGSLIIPAVLALLAFNLTFLVVISLLDGDTAVDAKLSSEVITLVGLGCSVIVALCMMFGAAALLAERNPELERTNRAA